MTNYGLKLDKPVVGKDYIFGSSPIPFEPLTNGDWNEYLPVKELQNLNGIEPYACVTFSVLTCLEALIKRKYNQDVNFSDRFLAFVSGTPETMGNSPQNVCEFLRKLGVPPEKLWPFDSTIDNYDEFYAPIPPKLYEIAREFLDNWTFKYEFVPSTHEAISQALKCSPLLISFSAWHNDGEYYYRPNGAMDNHAICMFYERAGEFRRVFDTYEPVIKDLRWDDLPMQVMRFWIEKKVVKVGFWQRIVNFIKEQWFLIKLFHE